MPAHPDILDQRESLRRPFAGSLTLHATIAVTILSYAWLSSRGRERWGDPNAMGGGGVAITPVDKIPVMPRSGIVNPVANDTESQVPLPPKQAKPQPKTIKDDPDAIALKMTRSKRKLTDVAAASQRYRPKEDKPNQLYSASGQAAVSPMFGGMIGAGGVGIGAGSPFGNRFGWYAELLRRKVAEKWQTNDIDPRLQSAPPVIVTFDILRDGTVRNVRVLQRGGNLAVDYSAQRAVQEAAPFQPLPREYERDSATIEFWFQLKR